MFANLQHNALLWLKEKTGLTAGFFILIGLAIPAALMASVFVFRCVMLHLLK